MLKCVLSFVISECSHSGGAGDGYLTLIFSKSYIFFLPFHSKLTILLLYTVGADVFQSGVSAAQTADTSHDFSVTVTFTWTCCTPSVKGQGYTCCESFKMCFQSVQCVEGRPRRLISRKMRNL